MGPAVTPVGTCDAPVSEERERADAEDPGWATELGLGGMERRPLPVAYPLEVPPAASIAGEDEVSGRAPLRLPDRLLAVTARDPGDVAERAVGGEIGDEELASVPGHPGEVPCEEAQARPVRGDARVRVEVPAARDDARLAGAVCRNGDELVDDVCRATALGMALANADPQRPAGCHAAVGIAVPALLDRGRDRRRLGPGVQAIETLVVEARGIDRALVNAVGAAPVLVHHRADVEAVRRHVLGLGSAGCLHQGNATTFGRAAFEPPHGAVLEPRKRQADPRPRDHLRRDRRRPRSTRGGSAFRKLGFQRRRLSYCAMRPTREQAWATLTQYTKSEALQRHALAVEASVRSYARLYGEDEEFWGCVALLHDFDYEIHPTLDKHPQDGAPILRERGVPGGADRGSALPCRAPRDAARHAAQEGALRVRRALRLRARVRARAADRPRRPRAEVRQEEAEAAVLRGRRAPRRGVRGGGAPRPLSSTSTSRTSSPRCSRSPASSGSGPPQTPPRSRSAR